MARGSQKDRLYFVDELFVYHIFVYSLGDGSFIEEDGIRHLVLCRVIMGKAEIVRSGSEQYHPSSDEFDSGVDNLTKPRKYIVWSTHMNTCVLPEYVVSFRAPTFLKGKQISNLAPALSS